MNEIKEIKIPEGVDRIAVKQHDDKIVIEFIPEKPKFKRGDILKSTITPGLTVIFDKMTSTTTFDSIYHNGKSSNHGWYLKSFRHATKEEEQEFFDELKADGKRWNAETMEIEDISKFKDGDFVYEDGRIMIVKSYPNMYHANVYSKQPNFIGYNDCYGVDFSSPTFRYATEEEKQLLIDAMRKDGKRWNADKKRIEDIPQPRFKVGGKVRIKDGISSKTHRHIYPNFTEDMDEFIGKELTVKGYSDGGFVVIFGAYFDDHFDYQFNEDWLEPYTDELKKKVIWLYFGMMPLLML